MRLAVALCTYNGERFLPEQLRSIAEQTRPPDELVVCDDCSSDASGDILSRFAQQARFPVRVIVNPTTLGSTKNFEQAIAACSADVIALADQDDIWLPHKLGKLHDALADHPEAGFAFSDAVIIDQHGRPVGQNLWDTIYFSRRERRRFRGGKAFRLLLRRYRVTGATMAFRTAFLDRLLPIPAEWVHDAWLAFLLSAAAPCVLLDEPLLLYRRHSAQQIGAKKKNWYEQFQMMRRMNWETFQAVADQFEQARDQLAGWPAVPEEKLRWLAGKVSHFRCRSHMRAPGVWRAPLILRELWRGHYFDYSLGWGAVLHDLLLK